MKTLSEKITNITYWFKDKNNISFIFLLFIVFTACVLTDLFTASSLLSCLLIISTTLSGLATKYGLLVLKNFQFKQIIRQEGPQNHLKKAGTPTMGGLLIVPTALLIANLININNANYNQILLLSLLTIAFMLIGLIDDSQSLIKNTNIGLSAKYKLFLQATIGSLFLKVGITENWINSNVYLFLNYSYEIGLLIIPLCLFVILAESNATNLTDGLDGLAAGCGGLVFTGISIQLILRENYNDFSIPYFCIVMAGSWLGFLFHNKNPAKVFMGDTGSLSMGAALSGVALLTNSLFALLLMGGVFVAESISVILQVCTFKITKKFYGKGKRLFLMSPLHHHYELKGNKEAQIVKYFWLTNLVLIWMGLLISSTL
ncbi:phospho-N-acetylmuramoyl-pentapeptide-transferase [Prochlorococcus sp. MIT 1223]|uniref:phospho-N-acetylmuramoyl-pentapeptide- transferase n=1 Tax=Prochlorococcus sp. MIT 1223 TaxID=3096217 RepID=UPI002A74A4F1|nr:phospho-N-acetylmuramoyl-pentapeptide-transferase [Prochlorococcus sp. MIT 1223]